jgi:hypothetical protein
VVDLRAGISGLDLPVVGIRTTAMVAMCLYHIFNCCFEHFGFCGLARGVDVWMPSQVSSVAPLASAPRRKDLASIVGPGGVRRRCREAQPCLRPAWRSW